MPAQPPSPPQFETDLAELEQLVARMERGDLSLEDAIGTFERGVALARACQQALREAEQKVQLLTQEAGTEHLQTLPPATAGDDDEGLD
jgi:exodeoxyribonuclease VII small subunit